MDAPIEDRNLIEMFYCPKRLCVWFSWLFMLVFAFGASMSARAQESNSAEKQDLFTTVRPQIMVLVREHEFGADVVEVSVVEASYPPELLRKQVEALGASLNNTLRGYQDYIVQLDKDKPNLKFLKASFAVDGLVDGKEGTVNLTPIAKAFAGAPKPHTVEGISVMLEHFNASPRTLQAFDSANVSVQGRVQAELSSVEYRIHLHTQDPALISIGAAPVAQPEKNQVNTPADRGFGIWIWTLVALAGIATGALVYFAVLRRLAKPS
jgi:hypothetical protein